MKTIFVFGSNLLGIHGAGAARDAHANHGAILGEGIGRTGDSYAIPTKDEHIQTMPLWRIEKHIDVFIDYARNHPGLHFNLTHIGCGLAGYKWERDIRPLFSEVMPANITILEPI